MQRASQTGGFTLVELLVVVVVISVLSATVAVSMTRVSLEQRTSATVQALSELRSSVLQYRVGAVFEGKDPFPSLEQMNSATLLPAGQLPANPFTGNTEIAESSDLAAAVSRSVLSQPAGWVYFASSTGSPVAVIFANSIDETDRTDPDSGVKLTANAL